MTDKTGHGSARPKKNGKLFDALAEVGVSEDDYQQVEKARRLIDAVNARLVARESPIRYAVTMNSTGAMPGRITHVPQPTNTFAESDQR